jgi:hypothetical protein
LLFYSKTVAGHYWPRSYISVELLTEHFNEVIQDVGKNNGEIFGSTILRVLPLSDWQ